MRPQVRRTPPAIKPLDSMKTVHRSAPALWISLASLVALAASMALPPARAAAPASRDGKARAAAHGARPQKIVIVSMPSVGWEDVRAGHTPNLRRLAADWSVGALSLRTIGSRTDLASAMASIGAGNRARGTIRPLAQGDSAAAPNAVSRPDGSLLVRNMKEVIADNAQLSFRARPGLLGSSLHRMGLKTGIAGNADGGTLFSTSRRRKGHGLDLRRFGALALADLEGRVDRGEVGDDLVVRDPATISGYRSNETALLLAARRVVEASDVSLIEVADTYRESLVAFAEVTAVPPPNHSPPQRNRALSRDDRVLAGIERMVDLRRDTLLVVSPTGLGSSQPEKLSMVLLAGVGARPHGWVTSAFTLRDGLATIPDIGPGILRLLGHKEPPGMSGQPLHSSAGPRNGRLEALLAIQENAIFHGRWVGFFFGLFVSLQGLLYLVAWRRIQFKKGPSFAALRRLCLAFMAAPVALLALVPFRPQRWGPAGPLAVIALICTAATYLALRKPWDRAPAGAPAFVAGLTFLVIAADLITGAHLQLSSLIGYSPVVAGRFYGMGNLSFALFATSALLVGGYLGAMWGRRGLWAAAALGVFAIVIDGHPAAGADFGGVLALVPGFGVLLLLLAGRRVSAGKSVALGITALATGLLVGALDATRPADRQTHIGRFVSRLVAEGPGGVADIIERKAMANWWLLTQSVLAISIPLAVVFLAIMLRSPNGKLLLALDSQPGLRQGLIAAAVTNLAAFAVNDSGVAIPAMGLAMAAPFCLATILGLPREVLEE